MMRKWTHNMRLSMLFSLVVLIILLITGLIMALISLALLHIGVMDRLGWRSSFPFILVILPASAIVGTFVALLFGRVSLKPLQAMIDATNRLAAGDFTARLEFQRPAQFKALQDSFNSMAEELSSIELLRNDFINNFSHEFKTPIVSIKGFAELLKDDSLPAEERSEYLDIIIRESARLATMSTNVLNLSRIENQTIVANRKPIDVSEQIRRCVLLLQTSWEYRNIDMDIDLEEVVLSGNEEMLSQVWLNLLDNAIKFTPDGGRIGIKLLRKERFAEIAIQDNGVGIAADEVKRIFDKFYHSDAGSAAPGNGIGLTLARKIARLHGGDITCASVPGEGSLFTVMLPLT